MPRRRWLSAGRGARQLPRSHRTAVSRWFVIPMHETVSPAAPVGWCLKGSSSCATFFGGVTRTSVHALMWQWSGGGGLSNGIGDFDQIDGSTVK